MSAPVQGSILIVEDERIVATDLQQMLAEFGYDSSATAATSEEALERATARCPDLVLMDIRIKGARDGIATAELLRKQYGVPVVYLTAHADEATVDRAKATDPQGYLLKPVKAAELRATVEVALHRHAMEKQLRARERWFSTTLRSIGDAVVTVDLAGRVTFMNSVAESLTGTPAAMALGHPAREILRLSSDAGEGPDDTPLGKALRFGHSVDLVEASLRNVVTGDERTISDSAAPVVDGSELLGAVMVFRDVTEQRKLQRQLEIADRLASLGTMAAGVAHEVNNPLAVIVANISFVQEELGKINAALLRPDAADDATLRRLEEVRTATSEMDTAAMAVAHIVSELRTFSRPGPAQGETDVARAVSWALRTASPELRHRARVVTELEEVPPVAIDETRLGQVLLNLLVNAAQAIEPGRAAENTVSVSARKGDGSRVVIEIRDTGSGIAPEVRPRIFEPFFTTKPQGQGTGLGLSICHGIVAAVGGRIEVESTVGKGSTFRLLLPAATTRPLAAPDAQARGASQRRGRVLIIDEDPLVLVAVARVLRDHEVRCVTGLREAREVLDAEPDFDVIFCDLTIPAPNVTDFYQALLRTRPEDARRVVFLTGGAVPPRSADFLAAVPNRRIEKPSTREAILEVVQEFLSPPVRARRVE